MIKKFFRKNDHINHTPHSVGAIHELPLPRNPNSKLPSTISHLPSPISSRGLTLVELMVAVAILGVLVTAVTNVLMVQMRSAKLQNSMGKMNRELAMAMSEMKKVISMSKNANNIKVMAPNKFILGVDLNNNGAINTGLGAGTWKYSSEILGWRLNPAATPATDSNMNIQIYEGPYNETGTWRYFAGQTPGGSIYQPQITDLDFVFYNANNEVATTTGGIMTIEIIIRARVKNPNPEIDEYKERTLRLGITPPLFTGF